MLDAGTWGWSASEQTLRREMLVDIGPMNHEASAHDPKIGSLFFRSVKQPRVPGERHR
jgi:hypothetical protein